MNARSLILFLTFIFIGITLHAQWVNTLPASVQNNILWIGDHEEGNTHDWTQDSWLYAGGGIFNTGGSEVEATISSAYKHSGIHSIKTTITNACQAQNGNRAVRIMRWTDKAWDNGGVYFPAESYYSTWAYFPTTYNPNKYAPWDPGDGGWWNVFQMKSNDAAGVSQPVWSLNVGHNDTNGEMYFYLYSQENTPPSYGQSNPIPIPVGQWVHLEMYYKAPSQFAANGEVKFWQNGQLILQANNVVTLLDEAVIWGLGNYTDHIDGADGCGSATVYFDDCIVATEAIHPHINPNNCPIPSDQTAFYVDINSISGNCDNNNPGTICQPFCDLNIVKNKLQNGQIQPGDTIYMRTGNYPSVSMYQINGTSSDPIVITNYPGENPVLDATHPNAPTNDYALRLDRCTYFELSGLEFTNARGQSSGGLMFNRADHNYIHNNRFYNNRQGTNQTWTSGIKLYVSSYNVIENNEIHDNNFNGIHTTSTDNNPNEFSVQNQYLNNHVYNHSGMGEHSDGIGFNSAYTSNNIISGNLVHDNEDDGIDTWATNNNTITHNIVYNSGLGGVGDGNGFKLGGYDQGTMPGSNFVAYNISYNNVSDGFSCNGSGGNELYNNVAYNNGKSGIEDDWRNSGQSDQSIIRNNILMDNDMDLSIRSQYALNSNYNLFYRSNGGSFVRLDNVSYNNLANYQAANPNESNSLYGDPKFVDLAGYDFHLQTTSPAINTGDPSNPGLEAYTGSAPEIGAFETERGVEINVRVMLEGPYDAGSNLMNDELRQRNNLPVANPWALTSNIPAAAYAVTGNNALVDWVLVELRDPTDLSVLLYQSSGLLQRDGDLVDFDGVSPVSIDWALPSSFYVVVKHKSHLPVMSPSPINVMNDQVTYDFTTANSYTGGAFGQKQLFPNFWTAYAGDGTEDRDINAQDNAQWAQESGMFDVYSAFDHNMNGDVSGADKIVWIYNNGIYSVVP